MQGSSKPLMGVQFPQGVLNVGLDKVVKSPHFQCGDYGFESLILHTMFSCFHNVELLLEPSFGQLEVKETALSMLLSSVV